MTSDMLDIRMQENLQIISKLRLLDDDLMNLVFDKNIEATELLLNIILKRTDLKVLEVVAQREYKNAMAGGRSTIIPKASSIHRTIPTRSATRPCS